MREIKFRGKDKKSGTFITGNLVYGLRYCEIHNDTGYSDVDAETVDQYTGLKDKNGKEIYEGDIIKYFVWEHKLTLTMNVVWLKKGWFITDGFYYELPEQWNVHEAEVIGNIHDNPELVKV